MRKRPDTSVTPRSWWMSVGLSLACALASLPGPSARASVVEALDLPGLVTYANIIVLGKVVAEQSHYDEHRRIVTDVEMIVERCEKGALKPGDSVIVRRLGGVVNGIGMRIEGEPSFQIGERTLLFGQGTSKGFRPVGMSQGAMRVSERDGQSWVRSGAAGVALLKRAPDGSLSKSQAALSEPRPLEAVLTEIRALVGQSAR